MPRCRNTYNFVASSGDRMTKKPKVYKVLDHKCRWCWLHFIKSRPIWWHWTKTRSLYSTPSCCTKITGFVLAALFLYQYCTETQRMKTEKYKPSMEPILYFWVVPNQCRFFSWKYHEEVRTSTAKLTEQGVYQTFHDQLVLYHQWYHLESKFEVDCGCFGVSVPVQSDKPSCQHQQESLDMELP
jgi:hypothetical protein